MAKEYNNPESRAEWGRLLEEAERERKNWNPAWFEFAAKSYERECRHAVEEEIARLAADRNFTVPVSERIPMREHIEACYAETQREDFATMRDVIDAEIAYERAYRINNFAFDRMQENMAKQAAARIANRGWSKPRRVKAKPTKFVRGPNGTRIPRSK